MKYMHHIDMLNCFHKICLGMIVCISTVVLQVLKNGIVVDGLTYHFLGHSNSNLAQKKCLLYQCTHLDDTSKLLACWGHFADIPIAAKRAKRIGLLLSGLQPLPGMMFTTTCQCAAKQASAGSNIAWGQAQSADA